MIKAIVFDCFGVLTTEAWRPFKTEHFGHDSKLFDRASHIGWQADRGLISYDEFMRTIAELAGITPAATRKAIERNVPNEELFAYISKLKQHYKLGLLSNVAGDYLRRIFSAQQLGLFDAIVLSYQSGFIKPEREAFENAARHLQVEPGECLFIDDQARNVNGAIEAGMSAVLYKNVAQLKHELTNLLKTAP